MTMTPDLFPPLLTALRSNMPPGTLESFLVYASVECGNSFEPWDRQDGEGDIEDSFFEPFAPGELPDELPGEPGAAEQSDPFLPGEDPPLGYPGGAGHPLAAPFVIPPDVPEISADSETPAVAAWCRAVGLNASVVGQWVWCDPHAQLGHDRGQLDLVLRAAGFQLARQRQSYFHKCTVNSRRQPGDKRRGGKLERFHGTCSAADYVAGKDMRPGWQLAKAARAKARRKS